MRCGSLLLALLASGCSGCFDRAPSKAPAPSKVEPASTVEKQGPVAKGPAPAEGQIRRAAVAGSWYPADPKELTTYLDQLLTSAESAQVQGDLIALVSPHAGYSFSGKAAAKGYKLLRGRDLHRVVILAVSHHVAFKGASISEATHYQTPLGLIPVDRSAVRRLRRCRAVSSVAEAEEREHSLEMQLPLLQRVLPSFSLVPVLIGHLADEDYGELATALAEVVDRQTLVVASSDFTHRGPNYSYEVPSGPGSLQQRLAAVDQGAVDHILRVDRPGLLGYVRRTGATICGAQPVALLLELLLRFKGTRGQVLSRYTSGDVTGTWDSTVSYVNIGFTGAWPSRSKLEEARSAGEAAFPLSADDKRTLLRLARTSLDASVRLQRFDPRAIKGIAAVDSLQRKAGAFVTLKCKHGPGAVCVGRGDDLRGCIGTIIPNDSVYETVAQRAASAALEDPRFPHRVGIRELDHITVEVSVLTPPRPVKSADDIIIGRHGIILSREGRSATFLPQVAPEQGWDRETTLRHLAEKAGIEPDDWRGASFQVYEAIVFSEGE